MKKIVAVAQELIAFAFAALPIAAPCISLVCLFWVCEGNGIFSAPEGTAEQRAYEEQVQRETEERLNQSMIIASQTASLHSP